MKKRLFIIAVLAIGVAACLGSCKKKTTEPTTDPTPTTVEHVCKHDSLIHVMAVEPTAEENGCIEHYKCEYCGQTFADAQATTPVENTILWATNYTIDSDCIIEKYLAEYAGDENYLWQFLRECLKNYDGSIYDFTGWENWTEEEWYAFWEYIDQLISEWGGKSQPNTKQVADDDLSILPDVAGLFLTAIIDPQPSYSYEIDASVMEFFDENYQLNQAVENIMEKFNDIQQAISDLSNKFNQQTYKDAMQQRYEKLNALHNTTQPYFRQITDKIKDGGVMYSQLVENPEIREEIANLSEEWMDKDVNDDMVDVAFLNLLYTYNANFETEKTMPEVYDLIANFSVAWEHEGYGYREMARNIDAFVMGECYVMQLIYYNTHPNNHWSNKQSVNSLLAQYARTLNNNKVVRHNDYFVCQIPGAEVSVEKQMKYLNCRDYLDVIGDQDIYMNDNDQMEAWRKWLLPNGGVSKEWPRTVYNYYAQKYPSEVNNDNFFYDKLLSVGFTNIDQSHSWQIVTDCDCKWRKKDNDTYSLLSIVKMFEYYSSETTTGADYLGYHTAINRKDGTLEFAQAIYGMNIKSLTDRISEKGSHVNVSYYGIELHK